MYQFDFFLVVECRVSFFRMALEADRHLRSPDGPGALRVVGMGLTGSVTDLTSHRLHRRRQRQEFFCIGGIFREKMVVMGYMAGKAVQIVCLSDLDQCCI